MSILCNSGCSESPAGTTLSLILDGIDTTLLSPVYTTISQIGGIKNSRLLIYFHWRSSEHLSSLFSSHSREHIVTNSERILFTVDSIVFDLSFLEKSESELVFFFSSKAKSLLSHVPLELLMKLVILMVHLRKLRNVIAEVLEADHGGSLAKSLEHI